MDFALLAATLAIGLAGAVIMRVVFFAAVALLLGASR
jgi:hypothetical protein